MSTKVRPDPGSPMHYSADRRGSGSLRVRLATEAALNAVRRSNSTFRWLFEPMLESVGFEIITADFQRQVYAEYACIKRPHANVTKLARDRMPYRTGELRSLP